MPEISSISVDYIEVVERHRTLDASAVNRLAASLKDIGLRHPITVRIVDTPECDGVPMLVAGAHRLAAAKALGWSHIDCIEVDDDALRAELWEIDENLMRAELTPAQQAAHLARRREVWEALETATNCRGFEGRGNKGFASETAQRTGVDTRTVQRDLARAAALGPDLRAVAGTSLDKGVELDALAKLPTDERADIIARARAGERVTARPVTIAADPLNDLESAEKQVAALMSAWNRAGPDARAEFLERIDLPVFDRTKAGRAA